MNTAWWDNKRGVCEVQLCIDDHADRKATSGRPYAMFAQPLRLVLWTLGVLLML